jgi:hypothetical protein
MFCKLHMSESAVVVVAHSQWFGHPDAEGRFQISDVPDGTYRLRVYHELVPWQEVVSLERMVYVSRSRNRAHAGEITMVAANYLQMPAIEPVSQSLARVSRFPAAGVAVTGLHAEFTDISGLLTHGVVAATCTPADGERYQRPVRQRSSLRTEARLPVLQRAMAGEDNSHTSGKNLRSVTTLQASASVSSRCVVAKYSSEP